jgi:prevent-host-death family protein
MKIAVTKAGKVLHRLLRCCSTEPVIITRRGKPIARLQPFPRTRAETDREILRRVIEHAPYPDFSDLQGDSDE